MRFLKRLAEARQTFNARQERLRAGDHGDPLMAQLNQVAGSLETCKLVINHDDSASESSRLAIKANNRGAPPSKPALLQA